MPPERPVTPPMPERQMRRLFLHFEFIITVVVLLLIGGVINTYVLLYGKIMVLEAENDVVQHEVAVVMNVLTAHKLSARTATDTESLIPNPFALPGNIPAQATTTAQTKSTPFKIVLPKKGERICRDTVTTFAWMADPTVADELRLTINSNTVPVPPLYDGSVTYSETGVQGEGSLEWKVGTVSLSQVKNMTIPDGDLYRIHYELLNQGKTVTSGDSGTFAIDTCEG